MSEGRKRLRDLGPEIAVGGGGGLLAGGPVGGAIGVFSPLAVWALREFQGRVLSREEEARVATALQVAQRRIEERLETGEVPRNDGFFGSDYGSRTAAERILEGVLVTAQRDFDERKADHYGCLFANIGFEAEVDPITAQRLAAVASELSYVQLQLLALIGKHETMPLPETDFGLSTQDGASPLETVSIRQELSDLGFGKRELVGYMAPADAKGIRERFFGPPSRLRLRGEGRVLHYLLELDRIPEEELEHLSAVIWASSRSGKAPAES
jgi:hypothetical protein